MGLLDNTTQQEYYNGNDFGNYQFTSLDDIINQFMVVYVGEEKIIGNIELDEINIDQEEKQEELVYQLIDPIKIEKKEKVEKKQ